MSRKSCGSSQTPFRRNANAATRETKQASQNHDSAFVFLKDQDGTYGIHRDRKDPPQEAAFVRTAEIVKPEQYVEIGGGVGEKGKRDLRAACRERLLLRRLRDMGEMLRRLRDMGEMLRRRVYGPIHIFTDVCIHNFVAF